MTERDYELLSAYLDGELSEAERASLEARLQTDDLLRSELDALRQTVALISSLPSLKAPRSYTLNPTQAAQLRQPDKVIPISRMAPPGTRKSSTRSIYLSAAAGFTVVFLCVVAVLLGPSLSNLYSSLTANTTDVESINDVAVAPTLPAFTAGMTMQAAPTQEATAEMGVFSVEPMSATLETGVDMAGDTMEQAQEEQNLTTEPTTGSMSTFMMPTASPEIAAFSMMSTPTTTIDEAARMVQQTPTPEAMLMQAGAVPTATPEAMPANAADTMMMPVGSLEPNTSLFDGPTDLIPGPTMIFTVPETGGAGADASPEMEQRSAPKLPQTDLTSRLQIIFNVIYQALRLLFGVG